MGVLLLTNTFGLTASSCRVSGASGDNTVDGALKDGYDVRDAIAGPRQYTVRAEAGAAHALEYEGPENPVTHAVITRADLFKNTVDADHIEIQYDPGFSADSTTDVEDIVLVGPSGQDWVIPISRTSTHFRARFFSSGVDSEYEYGKVFFSDAFSFGVEPDFGPRMTKLRSEKVQRVQPCLGYQQYWVEAQFSLTFSRVSLEKILQFESLPLDHAFVLYDSTGDILKYRAEHVVLASPWAWTRIGANAFNITLNLSRLAHYQ